MCHSLRQALTELLQPDAPPLREYDLIRRLSDAPWHLFRRDALGEPLSLFQTHFLLFHVLYQLRNEWSASGRGWLIISPLGIQLTTGQNTLSQGERTLAEHDPLATYYLDLDHLFSTSEADVRAMLDHFFQRLLHPEHHQHALSVLGLPADCRDKARIRQRYRSLAMQHHPDRGGDAATFQAIQAAWSYLNKVLP